MKNSNIEMKALWYPGYCRLEIAARPLPELAAGEVLVRVAACGICGSELETYKAKSPRRQPPLIMGHEFCGIIEEVGDACSDWKAGARVVSNSLVPCGDCTRCRRGDSHLCAQRQIFGMHRMGAFAEYVAVPSRCLLPWPDEVPAEVACLAEPLANGVHMVNLTHHISPQKVLVIGAGPIGLMAQQAFAVLTGAEIFVADLSVERLAAAKHLGAVATFEPGLVDVVAEVRRLTDGEGADLVIDAVGSALTKQQSIAAARAGGGVVWIGLHENAVSLNSYDIILPEKQVFGTYAATMEDLVQALDLMKNQRVDIRSWVHSVPLSQGADLFERMLAARGQDIKGVILPGEGTAL